MTARPEDDPEIRRKLLQIGQAADRAAFEVNQNSLFALFAIGRYRADEKRSLDGPAMAARVRPGSCARSQTAARA